jgi:hypothetical protein
LIRGYRLTQIEHQEIAGVISFSVYGDAAESLTQVERKFHQRKSGIGRPGRFEIASRSDVICNGCI